jgi:hypothetical protein
MTAFIRSITARSLVFTLICGGVVALVPATLSAQRAEARPEGEDVTAAQKVRDEFMVVLRKYPPSVGQVLKLDQTLVTSDQYLAPYPAIVAFLNQHPEVRRSPSFYLEPVRSGYDGYYYDPRERAWNNTVEMVGVFMIILTIAGTLAWLIRTAIDYRRWGRLAKVQAEAHTKLLDRFTGNDELLAYVQSSAGARFLKSSPITLDGSNKPMGAPLARILWSMQAGVVLAAAGIGLNFVSRNIDPYRAEPVFMFSTLALSIGVGFMISAAASYMMSKRLGLLGDRVETEES